jgi:hypothetical protein
MSAMSKVLTALLVISALSACETKSRYKPGNAAQADAVRKAEADKKATDEAAKKAKQQEEANKQQGQPGQSGQQGGQTGGNPAGQESGIPSATDKQKIANKALAQSIEDFEVIAYSNKDTNFIQVNVTRGGETTEYSAQLEQGVRKGQLSNIMKPSDEDSIDFECMNKDCTSSLMKLKVKKDDVMAEAVIEGYLYFAGKPAIVDNNTPKVNVEKTLAKVANVLVRESKVREGRISTVSFVLMGEDKSLLTTLTGTLNKTAQKLVSGAHNESFAELKDFEISKVEARKLEIKLKAGDKELGLVLASEKDDLFKGFKGVTTTQGQTRQ